MSNNRTFIFNENGYKYYSSGWQTISDTTPTQSQFLSDGIDDLTILDRRVQKIPTLSMTEKNFLLSNGKMFAASIDLNKYFDIRIINTVVT